MAIKIYDATMSKARTGKATLNVNYKTGLISLSKEAAEALSLKATDKIVLVNEDESPKDWYLAKHESGFSTREDEGRFFFNSTALARKFCDSIGVDYNSSYIVGKTATELDGLECWPIFISSGIKKPE